LLVLVRCVVVATTTVVITSGVSTPLARWRGVGGEATIARCIAGATLSDEDFLSGLVGLLQHTDAGRDGLVL